MAGKLDAVKEAYQIGKKALNKGLTTVGKPPKGMERVPGNPGKFRPKQTTSSGGKPSGSKEVAVRDSKQVARTATKKEARQARNSGARRAGGAAATVGLLLSGGDEKPTKRMTDAEVAALKANKLNEGIGKKKYNVGVSKGGVPFKEAFKYNRGEGKKTFTWNGKKYTTDLASEKSKKDDKKPAAKRKVGGIRRALFGRDGKMGGPGKGILDNKLTRAFTKRDELNDLRAENAKKNPKKKNMGGMMKSKMSSKGGKRGGMSNGGLAMTKVNGKSVPAFAADGKGANDLSPTKRKMGGMMKSKGMSKGGAMKSKGMAKGGVMKPKGMSKGGAMKKKGYANGGAVRSKMASKGGKRGGASSKPRGVGVAKRGFGKAMR